MNVGGETTSDSPVKVRTIFVSVSDVVSALQEKDGAPVDLLPFVKNPTFSWRLHVEWDDLDPNAVQRCADAWRSEQHSQAWAPANAKHWFHQAQPIGRCSLDKAPGYKKPAGSHWIPYIDSGSSRPEEWFCSICYHPDIAKLRPAIAAAETRVINHPAVLDILIKSCFIQTQCDAILHEATHTHCRNAAARQSSAASAGADIDLVITAMMGSINQSLETIAGFSTLLEQVVKTMNALKQEVAQLKQRL